VEIVIGLGIWVLGFGFRANLGVEVEVEVGSNLTFHCNVDLGLSVLCILDISQVHEHVSPTFKRV